MSDEPTFSEWLQQWLKDNPEWSQKRLAGAVKASEAAISDWFKGKSVPRDLRHITYLSEVTDADAHWLAHIAYGWKLPFPTDDKMRTPLMREAAMQLDQLERLSPDLIAAAVEVVRGLIRLAKKRAKN